MARPTSSRSLEEILRAPSPQHVSNLIAIIHDSIQAVNIELQVTLQLPPSIVDMAHEQLNKVEWLDDKLLSSEWHDKGWLLPEQIWL
eukprot:7275163-Prorocentrum_lima.AAC.1